MDLKFMPYFFDVDYRKFTMIELIVYIFKQHIQLLFADILPLIFYFKWRYFYLFIYFWIFNEHLIFIIYTVICFVYLFYFMFTFFIYILFFIFDNYILKIFFRNNIKDFLYILHNCLPTISFPFISKYFIIISNIFNNIFIKFNNIIWIIYNNIIYLFKNYIIINIIRFLNYINFYKVFKQETRRIKTLWDEDHDEFIFNLYYEYTGRIHNYFMNHNITFIQKTYDFFWRNGFEGIYNLITKKVFKFYLQILLFFTKIFVRIKWNIINNYNIFHNYWIYYIPRLIILEIKLFFSVKNFKYLKKLLELLLKFKIPFYYNKFVLILLIKVTDFIFDIIIIFIFCINYIKFRIKHSFLGIIYDHLLVFFSCLLLEIKKYKWLFIFIFIFFFLLFFISLW